MKILNICISLALVVGSSHATLAVADLTIHQNVTMTASGALAPMGSKGTVTTIISGGRGRTENKMESTSSLMRKFAKNLNSATIVLLEEEKMLSLQPEKKQYSEMTFEQMRAQVKKSMEQAEKMGDQGALPVSEDECQWSEPEMSVKKTKDKQRFANIKAQRTIISVSQTCTVPDTEKSCDMLWTMEYWNAKRMPGSEEASAFQEGMARAMGGEEALGLAQAQARGLMAMFKKGWDDILEESGKVKGYPVKTMMSLEMGGASCTTLGGQPINLDDTWGRAADAGVDAAAGSAAAHAGHAAGRGAAEAVGGGVGGSIAGSAVGAASRELFSGAFKGFGSKKKKEKEKKKELEPVVESADPAAGLVTLFKIETELTGLDENYVPNSTFTVPADWKKVKSATW